MGRAAVVLGGAESLPVEFARCPSDAVLISANQHGCLYTRCDYIVVLDDIGERLEPLGVPRIGPYLWAEYPYLDRWTIANSAAFGVWVAHLMGCAPIYIAGVDCYRSGYWHGEGRPNATGREKFRLVEWRELRLRVPDIVRAAGGPLVEIFGGMDGDRV